MRLAEQLHQLVLGGIGVLKLVHEDVFTILENLGGGSKELETEY
jgi:hypothetical protein